MQKPHRGVQRAKQASRAQQEFNRRKSIEFYQRQQEDQSPKTYSLWGIAWRGAALCAGVYILLVAAMVLIGV